MRRAVTVPRHPFLRLALIVLCAAMACSAAAQRRVQPVKFDKGSVAADIKGRIQGDQYIDYQLRATAGQRLQVSLAAPSRSAYFNVLPPESDNVAMYVGQTSGDRFDGLLPDDGVYALRVYLVRAAARRNEASDFKLKVSVTGKPLRPLPGKADAKVPGTRYHATTTVPCQPQYGDARQCEAGVIRRGIDGTATVDLRWDQGGRRRILFVAGKVAATDTRGTASVKRDAQGSFIVDFEDGERFTMPESLLFGG